MKIHNKIIDDISKKISKNIPKGLKLFTNEFENNCKAILKASFERFNLVTRDEFDIQQSVLLRTREKIEKIEKQLDIFLKNKNLEK